MRVVVPFNPHYSQFQILMDPARFKTLVCSRRFGKTKLAINTLIFYALRYPGLYYYIAPTYRMAKRIAWEELLISCPNELILIKHETELRIRLVTGGEIQLHGSENEDNLRGVGLHGCIIDETADVGEDLFDLVIRPMLADKQGFCWFIGTPKGKNKFYEFFIKDKRRQDLDFRDRNGNQVFPEAGWASFQFKAQDNPYLPLEEIENARKTMAPEYFRQEFEASFENYTGLIYKEFNEKEHTLDIQVGGIGSKNNIYVGIDTGKTTAVEFASLSSDKVWTIFDEIYVQDMLVGDICKLIRAKVGEWGLNFERIQFIIDSASQVKQEYISNGIYVIDAMKKVLYNIEINRSLFKQGKIRINKDRCPVLITQLKAYEWDNGRWGKKNEPRPKKVNDHCCDVLAYICPHDYASAPVEKTAFDYEEGADIEKRYGIFSDEYEKWEDDNMIDYRHGESHEDEKVFDPVTGYG